MELTVYHWILVAAFIGIVIWAFGRKTRCALRQGSQDSAGQWAELTATRAGADIIISKESWTWMDGT
jgi:hypothetical protein